MRVTIFGTGYVGLVTGACLAQAGHEVCCVDVDEGKLARIRSGDIPIFEPGLGAIIEQAVSEGNLWFTTDAASAVDHAQMIFIAVGTPPAPDGSTELSNVFQVARTIAEHMRGFRVIVNKSTVPVGTADSVRDLVSGVLAERGVEPDFAVASNPEFLKEGAAVGDFMKPDRIIVGTDDSRVRELMRELYRPFNRNHDKLMFMDPRSAELTKYAANAILATKISFMNEIANAAESLGADVEKVRLGIGSDPRIGFHFIYPGCGYGGSCFPKDVTSLIHAVGEAGSSTEILEAVDSVNRRQKQVLLNKVLDYFDGDVRGKRIALWGLAFKPGTDDMREAPSRVVVEGLLERGAHVAAHDPKAMENARAIFGPREGLQMCEHTFDALDGADALVICTEWNVYRSPNWAEVSERMAARVVFDGRNIYDPEMMAEQGFEYHCIGRPVWPVEPAALAGGGA